MQRLIDIQKNIFPDLLEIMQQRYDILHHVSLFQPIGRRGLSEHTNLTERIVRNEVDRLQAQGFIKITNKGMYMTEKGNVTLERLTVFMHEIMGFTHLERQLEEKLHVEKVRIVPGNSDEDEWVKQEMGKACIALMQQKIKPGYTIAVTGGTTMSAVAKVMTPLEKEGKFLFVPARGGVGKKVEHQANTIVAEMAHKTKSDYRLLYVPDPLSESAYQSVILEPSVYEPLQQIKAADMVLHGIGDALTMAKRRNESEETVEKLRNERASGEAFGYYFNQGGDIVHQVRTVGIQLEDLTSEKYVIAVAGGKSKAAAIISYFQQGKSDVFITDQAAAEQILKD